MPRRNTRTPEEQKAFEADQRRRRAENQRLRRQAARNATANRTAEERQSLETEQRYRRVEGQRRRRETARQDILENNHRIEDYLGLMDVCCEHCDALHFRDEKISNKGLSFNDCCSHGMVTLGLLDERFPIQLEQLFKGEHDKSNLFFERIRCYNNSLAFASFNANLVNFQNRRPGPFCFKIQGQIYYQINTTLYPTDGENPSNGQLFIIDQQEALEYRMSQNYSIDYDLMSILDSIIRNNNKFAKSYEMMQQEINAQRVLDNNQQEPEFQLLFSIKPGQDMRRYNPQRVNEVAAIFSTTANGEIPESWVTVRHKVTKELEFVSTMNPNAEPWIYPLFYPYGTTGWHRDMPSNKDNKRITRMAYIKYLISIRKNEFNQFLMGRRLFQQWVVDHYVKVEKDRIQWCKDNQKKLKYDTFQGLQDHMQEYANEVSGTIGKISILPSTFIGSPRYMQQCYQDAMSIVKNFGKPDIFLTMTCNPNWSEITENLLQRQQACDRPDIVARVFHLKKDRLLEKVIKKEFFGKVACYVFVIEFQKRGLPHMHLLITLERGYKITTADVVDKYISAEIPDPAVNIRLHEIVMKNMIHGPCADWCKVNGKCSKNFPKLFNNETTIDENGFPNYRRENSGKTYERPGGHIVDNRWVVPHCRTLLEIFDCHINVEIVSSILAVKYLYKYIYKGHDAATIVIENVDQNNVVNHDEIKNFIENRYVGPVEASYRILSKPLQGKSHSVVRLPVHLPNEHVVMIPEDDDEANMIHNLNNSSSMLLDFFELNKKCVEARQYTYSQIPTFFTYKKEKINNVQTTKWKLREKHFNTIGRMFSVSPTQIELFHLRLLLLYVKGPKSWTHLKTVNNQLHDTFTATCLALGLIEDDNEWNKAMEEGTLWMMPRRLRLLFVRILIHCQPLHPEELWEKFKDAMSEDFLRNSNNNLEMKHQLAYAEINFLLQKDGSSLANFPSMNQDVINHINYENDVNIRDNTNISYEQSLEIGNRQYNQLNSEQKIIVDKVLKTVREINPDDPTCYYIEGQGGSGKTFIYTTIINLLNYDRIKVSSMAFTGIAANLLPCGKTAHKTFGLPVPLYYDSSSNIKAQSKEGKFLRDTKVFIWDEAPMAPRYALEIADRTLQYIMNNDLPFGGKIMLLGGDFRQLLPVKVHGTRNEILNLSIKYSPVWHNFTHFKLTKNMRALPEEIEFVKFLLAVGDGSLNDENDNILLPDKCILPLNQCIVTEVFGKLIEQKKYDEICKCAILAARNVDVDEINEQVTNLFDESTEKIYTGIDSTDNCENGELTESLLPEFLNTLNPPNFPPYSLRLRKNCIVMLVRNLSPNEGLCNGTRLQILDFSNHLLKCKILTGDKTNDIVFLNRITLYSEKDYHFTFKRRQFPVRLAFAMTINKSQGQTFQKIGIDLRRDVFNHGQLYVAMSRVRSWNSLKIYLGRQRESYKVKNYVYKELYM